MLEENMVANCIKLNCRWRLWRLGPHYSLAISAGYSPQQQVWLCSCQHSSWLPSWALRAARHPSLLRHQHSSVLIVQEPQLHYCKACRYRWWAIHHCHSESRRSCCRKLLVMMLSCCRQRRPVSCNLGTEGCGVSKWEARRMSGLQVRFGGSEQ